MCKVNYVNMTAWLICNAHMKVVISCNITLQVNSKEQVTVLSIQKKINRLPRNSFIGGGCLSFSQLWRFVRHFAAE